MKKIIIAIIALLFLAPAVAFARGGGSTGGGFRSTPSFRAPTISTPRISTPPSSTRIGGGTSIGSVSKPPVIIYNSSNPGGTSFLWWYLLFNHPNQNGVYSAGPNEAPFKLETKPCMKHFLFIKWHSTCKSKVYVEAK